MGMVNAKMLLANQIAGSWFLHAGTYLLKLQIGGVILGGHDQACLGMCKPKNAIKA